MNNDSGRTVSAWMATTPPSAPLSPLDRDAMADVCIIGAGIAGMSVAYLLAQAGKKVLVLDDGPVGGGETGRTTAHLASAMDDRFTELERLHGQDTARRFSDSHAAAIDRIESIVQAEGIDCDFRRLDGYLFNPPNNAQIDLQQELEAAHRAGRTDARLVDRAPIPGFDTGQAIQFPNQGQFHPLKYLLGLQRGIERLGGTIHTGSHAQQIDGGKDARIITSDKRVVRAGAIVVATNAPVNDLVAIHTKQAPYRTYVIAARIPKGSATTALYWDTLDPYHYIRVQEMADHDLLIVGGEDHKTGQAADLAERFDRLEQWARRGWTMIQSIEQRWSGQVIEPIDGIAYIGRNPLDRDNVYICTGDSGQGMTHGTIAGMLITDLILGKPNPWASIYDPTRIRLGAGGEFAKENLNVAAQYGDWVTAGEVASAEQIAPGSGALLRRGLHKVAVYRDAEGRLHEFSATCTHLGCIVRFNPVEKTWDCPCHGSRFSADGRVVNGPAISNLNPASA